MKLIVLALGLLGSNAFACEANEAQFIAKVAVVQMTKQAGVCQVKFSQIVSWQENMLCPLDVDATQAQPILTSCDVGPQASGVVVQKDGHLEF